MHILVDIRLLSKGGHSGIEEFTCQLLQHLLRQDNANRYIFFYSGIRKSALPDFICRSVKSRTADLINWRWPNKLPLPPIDYLIKDIDIIYNPHLFFLRRKHKPQIITIHDLSFLRHPYFFSFRQQCWHWRQKIGKQIQQANLLTAVSQYTKQEIIEIFKVPEEKIKVIYPGINPLFLNESQPTENLPSLFLNPYILYLGTVEPRKNVEGVIKAFGLVKQKPAFRDFKLVIAGKLGWLYKDVATLYHRSAYRQDIKFLGSVNDNQRLALYKNAAVFIYPSFFEGFGLPPLEAQACGCPVIASDRSSLPEVLGKSAVLINPWQTNKLAEAIEAIIANSALRNRLVAAGRENSQRFSWKNSADKFIKLFYSLT